jgi:hypothetical protein
VAELNNKRPSYQWYPGDARRDTGLQSCRLVVRGLWREMLDLMHDGEPYGHLTAGGQPIGDETLARMIGEPVKDVRRWVQELEDKNVFDRTDEGVIFSRRMVRDQHIRTVRAESGRLGGNTTLLSKQNGNHGDKRQVKRLVKQTDKQNPTPAVAVAVATAVKGGSTAKKPPASGDAVPRTTGLDVLPKADCDELFELWTARRGVYAYSRFRKNMLLLFQSELTRYTTPEISDAIIAYAEWVEEQPDKEQGFCTLDRFITEIAKWVRFGKMPYVVNGEMTERGQWAGSRELREESLAKRSA